MAAHQAPRSLGFCRQEHWSGLPFPSPMHESEKWKWSCSVVSDSSRLHGLQPTRLLHPCDFPGKSAGVGCHCLLIFILLGLPRWLNSKESTCQCRTGKFDMSVRKIPWRRKWKPTPIVLPGKSYRQKSLVGYMSMGLQKARHDWVTKQQHT